MLIIACSHLAAPPTLEQCNMVTSLEPLEPSVAWSNLSLGAGSLFSEPRTWDRATSAALSFHSSILKMGAQCLLEQYLVSAREGHQQWFPTHKGNACNGRNWHALGNHGTSYGLASWWDLILGLPVPLPMENGTQTFMILPPVLWIRDLQMALGFQWS